MQGRILALLNSSLPFRGLVVAVTMTSGSFSCNFVIFVVTQLLTGLFTVLQPPIHEIHEKHERSTRVKTITR